jgi:carbonic anhydrase
VKGILENNEKWVNEKNEKDPDFFRNLARPQKPQYLYFGCSDSRVPANEILGLGYDLLKALSLMPFYLFFLLMLYVC